MKRIFVGGKRGGVYTLIDDIDYKRCKAKSWYMSHSGRPCSRYKMGGKWMIVPIYRFILDFPKKHVDHVNRNPLDNRRQNLRLCTVGQNLLNKAPYGGRSFKGIRQAKSGSWEARLHVKKICLHLGTFSQKLDAAKAYNDAALKYYGEFAWLNPV